MKSSSTLRGSWSGIHRGGNPMAFCLSPSRLLLYLAVIALGGCSSNFTSGTTITGQAKDPVNTYLAGAVGNLQTYTVDHTANTFVVTSSYSASGGAIQESGEIPPSTAAQPSGIENLESTYQLDSSSFTNGWLVEIPGEAGLAALENTNSTFFAPLAPTQSCPNFSSAQTFLFVTVPATLNTKSTMVAKQWSPAIETAFGSVSVTTSGNSVNFASINQSTLSGNAVVYQLPFSPLVSTAVAACSPTFFGETVSYPTSSQVSNPGQQQTVAPSSTIAIGPSGFLVEDDGQSSTLSPPYENLLGAGFGAIGLPEPASALKTATVVGAQYQGILYGASSSAGFSLISSFGYPNQQAASCAANFSGLSSPPSSTDGAVIYGGEFANDNPSSNASGNCDLAIDLGQQNAKTNGLYNTNATVYVSSDFPGNSSGNSYSFPAVAIAGQIAGKYAVFLIGVDTTQPWGIYLLQSN